MAEKIIIFLNFDYSLRVTRNSSSVRRELFLLVVEALHCSGSHSACRGAHLPVVQEDHALVSITPGPFEGVRVPVALFQVGPPVCTRDPSIHARARSVNT